jgi:hypothetical protein
MKITIYKYAHPEIANVWIYTGQAKDLNRRDKEHRYGKSNFGRRFKEAFPDAELPRPVSIEIEVMNPIEANEEETIAIFVNRTWHAYGGFNFTFPGTLDYSAIASVGGLKNVESGHLQSISSKGGIACGALMEKEKKGIFSPEYDRVAAGRKFGKISGKIGGPKGMHIRWHVNRGVISSQCKHCTEAA